MTTVIRVKRRLQDNPVEAVRLECKRRRTEEAESLTSFEKVLGFIGTVEKKEDFICQRTLGVPSMYVERMKRLRSNKPDILTKMRQENQARSEENRFKLISCLRSRNDPDELDTSSEEKPQEVTILDVHVEKPELEEPKEEVFFNVNDDDYVYDLYSAEFENEEDYSYVAIDNVIGIEPFTSEYVFDKYYRENDDCDDDSCDPDEDDSNDENNWRNSYPDDEGSGCDEIDILTNDIKRFDQLYVHSSDDEDKYNYDKSDSRNQSYQDAANLAGSSYAKYKMNVLKEGLDKDDKDDTK